MYQHINMNWGMKYVILPCGVDIFVARSVFGGIFQFWGRDFFGGWFLVKFLRILFLHIKVHEIRPPLFSSYDQPILPLPLIKSSISIRGLRCSPSRGSLYILLYMYLTWFSFSNSVKNTQKTTDTQIRWIDGRLWVWVMVVTRRSMRYRLAYCAFF